MSWTPPGSRKRQSAFATTRWSVVLAARGADDSRSRQALAELFEAYWYPLYAFARRRGQHGEDARDAVQGFFAKLLEGRGLRGVEPDRGRFRAYLLGAFKHFLAGQRARAGAQKRGGGVAPISLDLVAAEARYVREPADDATPEGLFERRWALTVLDHALRRLREESRDQGREREFDELRGFLTGESPRGTYREVAARLGMREGAVRVAAHRLRRRFAATLRREIAPTVERPGEIEAEIRFLLAAIRT